MPSAIVILPFFFLFFRQLALCCQQECCCPTTRANIARTLSTQKSHTEERDDKSRASSDGGGRGHFRFFWGCGGRPHYNPWRSRWRRCLTRKAVTHRRTSLHAVARGSQNQMAKYTVVKPTSQALVALAQAPSATRSTQPPFSGRRVAHTRFRFRAALLCVVKTSHDIILPSHDALLHLIRTGPLMCCQICS